MATPPDSPMDEALFELEPSRVPKHRPVALEDLCRQTKFTRQEIRVMYRGFKQVSQIDCNNSILIGLPDVFFLLSSFPK